MPSFTKKIWLKKVPFIALLISCFLLFTFSQKSYAKEITLEELNEKIEHCSAIQGRIDRLICYDALAKKLGHKTTETAEKEEDVLQTIGFWEVSKKRTAAGEYVTYLKNDAVENVISKAGISRKPTLVISCKNGQTEVYVDWKSSLLAYFTTRIMGLPIWYQMDSDEAIQTTWELSTDKQALFAPDPVEFVKKLRQHERIIFQVTPQNDIAQTIVHDINGINSVLPILIKECY